MAPFDSTGEVFKVKHKVVYVHRGARGPRGFPGATGPEGPQGDSFHLRGLWTPGVVYCPLDAVTSRSALLAGVNSLFIQKDEHPCDQSTVPPYLDPTRWAEIGAVDIHNAFGGIWQVFQLDHPFTKVGEPVGFSLVSNSYVLADARLEHELAIGVVREVVSDDIVILQSTGEVPDIDPAVITPDGSVWEPGKLYYTTTTRGRLSLDPPEDHNYFVNPILLPTQVIAGKQAGVVLPWTPVQNRGRRQLVGYDKFFFTATAGQTVIEGVDDEGNTLAYDAGDEVEVFVNGLNRRDSTFTADDGTTIVLSPALALDDVVEVWVPEDGTIPVLPSRAVKLDTIEPLFNGVTTTFPLEIEGSQILVQDTLNLRIWLDASPQEPLVDYHLIEDPGSPGFGALVIDGAPPAGTRFWGLLLQEVAGSTGIIVADAFDGGGPDTDYGMTPFWIDSGGPEA